MQGTEAGSFRAFVPSPLPPDPPIRLDERLQQSLEAASMALGRLDGIGRLLSGPDQLIYSYVRKEAVLSSQIEGTQSSLADLLLHEHSAAPGVALEDVNVVSNYVAALDHGIRMLAKLPVSLRLIREVHGVLVHGTRGSSQAPGEFRRVQNWIGGTSPDRAAFVPPPALELPSALAGLEKFIHAEHVPTLLKAGLAHAQFETIHPFLDGNGRVGRILIPLMLVAEGAMEKPWLYLSLHFRRHRTQYYELLQAIRLRGEWEPWLEFFFEGIRAVSTEAVSKIRELLTLFDRDRARVADSRGGSIYQQVALHSNLEVYNHLRSKVAITIPETAAACRTTKPTVARALDDLQRLQIAKEITGRSRNRVYVYNEYLAILNRDEP